MTRTYGTLTYASGQGTDRGEWVISAEPHVMTRVKRVLKRVQASRTGAVHVADTLDVARDLEWLCDRYPLAMDDDTTSRLTTQTTAWRTRETAVQDILTLGGSHDYGDREPGITPRPYQLTAANLAIATGRLLLTDDVGLGKTITGALVLRGPGALPAVAVVPTHLQAQWEREIQRTLPWVATHVVRTGRYYDPATSKGVTRPPDVLIITYSKLAKWADHLAGWARTVIFDEAQELRHSGTGKYIAAAQIADRATYRVGLTATPVYNYGVEIHNIMQVLDSEALGTHEEFVREWCGGRMNYQNPAKTLVSDPAALGSYLRDQGLMLGRTRREVGRELPPAITVLESVDADPKVIEQARGDAAEMARLILNRSAGHTERFTAAGQLDMLMRQATGVAKAPFVAAFVRLLLESEPRVVLCGWHREVYDVWLDALAEYGPVLYTGSESTARKAENAARFMSGESRVLILSLRSGVGLDGLQDACKVIVFGELDWSPQVHDQAVGRLRRDGQGEEPVVVYYLLSDSGSDPAVAEYLQLKRGQAEPMLSPDGKLFARPAIDRDRVKLLAASVLGLDPASAVGGPPVVREIPAQPPAGDDGGLAGQAALFEALEAAS